MRKIKISIVIPVYNVAEYIERCARSLFEQTLEEMEFIFVDDRTPDNSVNIIETVLSDYPNRTNQVTILHNEENIGVFQTRLKGQLAAQGEYVATVDSDDWVETNAYEKLYEQILCEKTDCLIFGYYREFNSHTELCDRIFDYSNGKQLILNYYKIPFEFVTWGVLVKNDMRFRNHLAEYYQNAQWENITMWEDVAVMVPYFYNTKRIAYSHNYFYHYNKANVNSAVNTFTNKKIKDALNVVDYLADLYKDDRNMKLSLACMMLGAKNPILDIDGPKKWRQEHPWCNRYIMHFSSIPLKIRLFYWLLAHKQYWAYDIYKKKKQ